MSEERAGHTAADVLMMARLFIGNFDFEHRLALPTRQISSKLGRINAELATSWLAVAEDGDFLWTPQPIESSFFEQAIANGLPRVNPVVSFDAVPRGVECLPWGWTDEVRRLCDVRGWRRNDPPHAAVRAGNSRRFSASLEREWNVGLDGAIEIANVKEFADAISVLGLATRWVVKAEFGMSGRERILGCGEPKSADLNWVAKRIVSDGVVFLEPWVERLDEVGIQIEVPQTGLPQLIGLAPMLVDERGQYAGSWFASPDLDASNWERAVEVALDAAQRLQELRYFGPLGIDAMRYRETDGTMRLRPLQDVNARWTMGRLSLGWRRRLIPGETHGCWRHFSRGVTDPVGHGFTRVVSTSANWGGGVISYHNSCVMVR